MSGLDRARRRIDHRLEDGEGLLASVVGLEDREGLARRKVAVIATDRRLLVVWLRPGGRLVSLPYQEVHDVDARPDGRAQQLEIKADESFVVRAIADGRALELLSTLVHERLGGGRGIPTEVQRVRVLGR